MGIYAVLQRRAYKLPDQLYGVEQKVGKISFSLTENTVKCLRVMQVLRKHSLVGSLNGGSYNF